MDSNPPSGNYKANDVVTLGGKRWTVDHSLNVGSVGEALLVNGTRGANDQAVLKVTYPERRADYESDFALLAYRYTQPQGSNENKHRAMQSAPVTSNEERLY